MNNNLNNSEFINMLLINDKDKIKNFISTEGKERKYCCAFEIIKEDKEYDTRN